jgi:cyclopropane-fatty-acyl-phospholipid synthase
MIGLPKTISSRRAATILRRVFERIPTGFAFRLWDGTVVQLGEGTPVCTAVIKDPATFIRLMRDPSPLNFAEAYVETAIDIEGDLYLGMKVADAMEEIRLSPVDKLSLFVSLWRS